ncbi:MAG: hypothetical protein Q4G40_09985, partial [Brachybacterium sp.]|nr:hypothetical protein [Brachybacterium sp.]
MLLLIPTVLLPSVTATMSSLVVSETLRAGGHGLPVLAVLLAVLPLLLLGGAMTGGVLMARSRA